MDQTIRRLPHVTVGPASAQFTGETDLAVQAAVDYVAARGGGTVELLPGTYCVRNSIRLRSSVSLVGAGEKSILLKAPSVTVPLAEDVDWYQWCVTVEDPTGFTVGSGLVLQGKCPHSGRSRQTKHTVTVVDGNTLWLDSQPRENFWIGHEAEAATVFPMVTADWVQDIAVANLVIDGDRERNAYLNGNYGGGMFFQDCERVRVEHVQARNVHSDALSFQIVHDLTVENCRFENCITAIHPGSGSQRPVIRGNEGLDCGTGLGWCWGVKHGVAEGNTFERCKTGISIGHRDTDNVMRGNTVRGCTEKGFHVRPDPRHQAAHRNLVEDNLFEDIGSQEAPAHAIDVDGPVDGMVLRKNRVVCTRPGLTATGLRIGPEVTNLTLDANSFEGVPVEVQDER